MNVTEFVALGKNQGFHEAINIVRLQRVTLQMKLMLES